MTSFSIIIYTISECILNTCGSRCLNKPTCSPTVYLQVRQCSLYVPWQWEEAGEKIEVRWTFNWGADLLTEVVSWGQPSLSTNFQDEPACVRCPSGMASCVLWSFCSMPCCFLFCHCCWLPAWDDPWAVAHQRCTLAKHLSYINYRRIGGDSRNYDPYLPTHYFDTVECAV